MVGNDDPRVFKIKKMVDNDEPRDFKIRDIIEMFAKFMMIIP